MKYLKDLISSIFRHLVRRPATLLILLSAIAGGSIAKPTEAAETVNFRFSIFEVSVTVDDLEIFSKTGELRGALDMASRYISASDLASFRRILTERADVPITVLSRFLYTSQGERMLDILGEYINTGPNLSGNRAIRAAAVLATADKENGLSLLNFLRKFPTSDIYFDIQSGLQTVSELSDLIQNTQKVVAIVNEEASRQAITNTQTVAVPQLKDLRIQGSSKWERYSFNAPALDGKYEIPFYLFTPQLNSANIKAKSIPAIVIYPGLISAREPLLYLAEHLASYGFAVILTVSPNSSIDQLDKLIVGLASEIAPPKSFVERPQDITAVLNYVEKLPAENNAANQNINWNNVGIVGHSFGGYAALALVSDAQIQFEELAKVCRANNEWNPSLLLQCVALGLPNQAYKLGDPRIKSAIAVSPVTSYILGKASLSKITVPVAIMGSSDDTFAPVVSEQIIPFTWLTNENRYLVLLNRAGHTAVTAITSRDRLAPEVSSVLAGPNPIASQNYLKLLSVAFFKKHLLQESIYDSYLTPEYFDNISTKNAQVSLLRSLSLDKVQ